MMHFLNSNLQRFTSWIFLYWFNPYYKEIYPSQPWTLFFVLLLKLFHL